MKTELKTLKEQLENLVVSSTEDVDYYTSILEEVVSAISAGCKTLEGYYDLYDYEECTFVIDPCLSVDYAEEGRTIDDFYRSTEDEPYSESYNLLAIALKRGYKNRQECLEAIENGVRW